MVGAEPAETRLERAGDELGRQRQRLRRLDARAAQQRAQRRHRLHRRPRRRHQRRLDDAPAPAAPGASPTLLQTCTAARRPEEAPGDLLRPAAAVERREVEPVTPARRRLRAPGAPALATREPSEAQPKPRQEVSMPVVPSVTRRMPVSRCLPARRLAAPPARLNSARPHARPPQAAARSSARRRPSWTAVSVGLAWPEVGSTAVEPRGGPGVPKTRQWPSTTPWRSRRHADRPDLVGAVPGVREHRRRPGLGTGR